MVKRLTAKAPAKINFFLDVSAKRPDGYHNICSVMQTVSLYDTVTAERSEAGVRLTCSDPDLPTDGGNIAYRAAEAFFAAANVHGGVALHIEKQIPVASGLAGGSTDAAAVLLLLNRMFSEPLAAEALLRLGGSLGADVPFCMTGGRALCTGAGEIMTPLADPDPMELVIARAGDGVSTPAAYRALDDAYGAALPKMGAHWERPEEVYFNIFESVVLPRHREAAALKEQLLSAGASVAMMSGSGPAVFGIFAGTATAVRVAEQLRRDGTRAYACRPCSGVAIL